MPSFLLDHSETTTIRGRDLELPIQITIQLGYSNKSIQYLYRAKSNFDSTALSCMRYICLERQTHFLSWGMSSHQTLHLIVMATLHKSESHMCWHRPLSALGVWCEGARDEQRSVLNVPLRLTRLSVRMIPGLISPTDWIWSLGERCPKSPPAFYHSVLREGVFTVTWSDGVRHYEPLKNDQSEQQAWKQAF